MNDTKKLARIATNKSLLKEFHDSNNERIVYLNDGDEFQIQLFNPYDYVIGVSFTFNSDNVDNSKLLVLKPGERIWLDRYLNEERKLKFSTYEVGNSKATKKAIEKNGIINIYFYKEQEKNYNVYVSSITTYPTVKEYPDWDPNQVWYTTAVNNNDTLISSVYTSLSDTCNTALSATTTASYASASIDADGNYSYSDSTGKHYIDSARTLTAAEAKPIKNGLNSCVNKTNFNKSIETGRIEKGSHSNQKFNNYYGDFNSWYFKKETIKILPVSQKQISSNDLNKKYCVNCGRKIKKDFKYCPSCGAKQD